MTGDWKDALRRDFEQWLQSLDEIPPAAPEEPKAPDLYSFYEQLAILSAESRRANRRTAEAFSQWGDTLKRFDEGLQSFREMLASAAPEETPLSRGHALAMVEMLDRLRRTACAFDQETDRRWWQRSSLRRAWQSQREAFAILLGHFESFLAREEITKIDSLWQPFDPALMCAEAAEPDSSHPPNTVIEELSPGYLVRGDVLRPAHVKVSR